MQAIKVVLPGVRRGQCMLWLRVCGTGDDGPCVPVTPTTARTCCEAGTEALVDACCRLWRPCWTTAHDDNDDHTLRRLPVCYSETGVCLNPYHWSVSITPTISADSRTSTTYYLLLVLQFFITINHHLILIFICLEKCTYVNVIR